MSESEGEEVDVPASRRKGEARMTRDGYPWEWPVLAVAFAVALVGVFSLVDSAGKLSEAREVWRKTDEMLRPKPGGLYVRSETVPPGCVFSMDARTMDVLQLNVAAEGTMTVAWVYRER